MKLLLLSNSTMAGEPFLGWPKKYLQDFIGITDHRLLFIPYAGVNVYWDGYAKKVSDYFNELGHTVISIYKQSNFKEVLANTDLIMVGGGNTFNLVHHLHKNGLVPLIRQAVLDGKPYIGWSAGANVACPTLCTTNDMPIIQPLSFETFNLVPFQINPHYLDSNPIGHGGETREDRINEYLEINRDKIVLGLREGSGLWIEDNQIKLFGGKKARYFQYGNVPKELDEGSPILNALI
ncbi:dipeptidase PepE [Candidatus Neomarinimicrobiota bacterium]